MRIKIKVPKVANHAISSAEVVASVDDLLTDILLRLPIKSLTRSKLVSKHWHSLITDPGFCIRRNPNPNPAIGLFLPGANSLMTLANSLTTLANFRIKPWFEYVSFDVNKPNNPPYRKLEFTKDRCGISILQSCNGLLLCCSFQVRDCNRKYYVYNPTTNKFSKLPKLESGDGISMSVTGMSLAFDPAKSPNYKVVCVRGSEPESGEWQYHIEVYSSEAGPWRKCGEPFTGHIEFENGVYWNNAIHWIRKEDGVSYWSRKKDGDSLYFNLDDDERRVRIMPMPDIRPIRDSWDWRSSYYFGESCDHLHYIDCLGPHIKFNVYEMNRDYSKWFVKYHVDLSHALAATMGPDILWDCFNPMDWRSLGFSIFCLVRGEEEKDSFLVLQVPGKVVRFSLDSTTFEIVHEFESDDFDYLRFPGVSGFQYIESLCCV